MSEPVISLKNVTKRYGSDRGITDVSFNVMPGQVYGFLGPNGAGKTTTISLMTDLIRPTSGKLNIFGLDSVKDSLQIRQKIGFLTDDMAMDKGLAGWQQLEYWGNLRGKFAKNHVNELAKQLSCNLNKKIKTLSRGNRQKVGLISALMHDPELLILDEPTSGLDPIIQQQFNKIILERKSRGKTAFISSHILGEVQEICDEVAFIREGKIIDVKGLNALAKSSPKQVHFKTSAKELAAKLKQLTGVNNYKHSDNGIVCTFTGDINQLLRLLSKYEVEQLTIADADLESTFMKYYEA